MLRQRLILAYSIVCLLVVLPANSFAYRHNYHRYSAALRQRMIQTAQANLASAQAALSAAQQQMSAAQTHVDSAHSRISQARLSMATAKDSEHKGHLSLVEMQDKLIDEAGEDSEIYKARAELRSAQQRMREEAHRVITS